MKNKRLEDRLLKYGKNYADIIRLIEKCESGNVGEIRISKDEKITESPILDKMIFTYLKKLKIAIVYSEETKKADAKEDTDKKCEGGIHVVLNSSMNKTNKIKTFKKNKNEMIKIDTLSFVICNKCSAIEEIK